MTITASHSTHMLKRLGALLVMGVGITLVGLGASSQAEAAPFDPAVPFVPGDSIESRTNVVRGGSGLQPPQSPLAPPSEGSDVVVPEDTTPQLPENPVGPPAPAGGGDKVGLNPQPLPPGPDRGIRIALNPQPLPPGPDLWLPFLRLPGF